MNKLPIKVDVHGDNLDTVNAVPMHGAKPLVSVRLVLLLIILIGAWLRIDATLSTVVDYPIRADAAKYVAYAYNMNNSSVFSHSNSFYSGLPEHKPAPDSLCTPGYPAFLSLLLGEDMPGWGFIHSVMLVQALLGVLAIFLVYFISRSVMPAVWALLPSALVAISPKLIIAGTYILTETLFTTMLLVSLAWIVLLSRRQSSIWVPLIGGVLLSATALVRPTLQYVLPFILMAIIPLLSSRQKWRYGGAMLLGFLLVATPWIVRNVISTGRMSDPTLMISSLVHGHYPFMMFNFQVESLGYPYRFDPDIAEISKSTSAAISGITKRAAESPALYLAWYLIGKPIAFLSWTDPVAAAGVFTYPVRQSPYLSDPLFIWTLAVMKVTHWLWIALGVFAAIFALMPRLVNSLPVEGSLALRVLSFTCIYFIFIHVVGLPIARYSIPLMPVIFILSGYGAYQLYLRGMASWRASAHASA